MTDPIDHGIPHTPLGPPEPGRFDDVDVDALGEKVDRIFGGEKSTTEPSQGAQFASKATFQVVEDVVASVFGAGMLVVGVRRAMRIAATGRVRWRDGFVLIFAARQVYQSVTRYTPADRCPADLFSS